MHPLDDLKLIEKYDSSGMLGIIESFPKQCEDAKNIGSAFNLPDSYKIQYRNIVCAGLGGSAIASDILKSCLWHDLKVPIFVNRNYILPSFAGEETLVIASSYSGNTEETLSAYRDAKRKKAKLVVVTSGGNLKKLADRDGVPVIAIPKGLPPRSATGYMFFPVLILLSKLGIVKDACRAADESIKILDEARHRTLGFEVPARKNIAKKIALSLDGKYPVIYASQDYMDCVAVRWRGELAENAKTLSSSHQFPEMNHNEIVGWKNPEKILKNFVALFLRDSLDHPRISERMDITEALMKKEGFSVIRISSSGRSRMARIFSLFYIGDFVSFYLAILNGTDPTPVERIDYLKKALVS